MKTKSFLSLFAVAVLVLSLFAGCSGGGNTTSASTASGTAATGSSADQTKAPSSEAASANDGKIVDLTLFVDETWWSYNTWEGKIPQMVTEKTGVNIIPTVAVDENQLQLMVSSGDLPDMICSYRFDRLSDSALCYSYNELIDQYAPDFEVDPVTKYVNSTLHDGKFYVIKNDFASPQKWKDNPKALHQGPGISFRKDILEGLGNPEINSIEDLENVYDMVLAQYPGVVPIVAEGMDNSFRYMKVQLAVHSDNFYEDEAEQLKWRGRDPQLLEWYKLMNKWYHKGYWTADNLAFKNADQYKQVLMNGEAFSLMAYDNTADTVNTEMKAAGKDYYMVAKPEWLTDEATLFDYRIGWRGLFITRNCSNPEAAINFAKYAYSEEGQQFLLWGEEDVDWHYGDDGYPVFDTWEPSDKNSIMALGVRYWGWLTCDNIVNGMGQGVGYEQTFDVKRYLTDRTERKVYIGMANPAADSDESATLSRVNDLLKTEGVKVLLADNEDGVVTAYNNMITMAESMGLNDLEAWANSVYPQIKEGYFAITDE
ncbi:extracellular solute-binding protein [Ruminococcaceae bacterium OttesenSCG-928-L11]|nr:extracellular solute-binding protein [Ruminococcaceae bacterium OttesenSCG-928-L11]